MSKTATPRRRYRAPHQPPIALIQPYHNRLAASPHLAARLGLSDSLVLLWTAQLADEPDLTGHGHRREIDGFFISPDTGLHWILVNAHKLRDFLFPWLTAQEIVDAMTRLEEEHGLLKLHPDVDGEAGTDGLTLWITLDAAGIARLNTELYGHDGSRQR